MKTIIKMVSVMFLLIIVICLFNHSAFYESYCNGFYQMRTPLETVAAFFGNISYHIVNFK